MNDLNLLYFLVKIWFLKFILDLNIGVSKELLVYVFYHKEKKHTNSLIIYICECKIFFTTSVIYGIGFWKTTHGANTSKERIWKEQTSEENWWRGKHFHFVCRYIFITLRIKVYILCECKDRLTDITLIYF